MAMASFYIPQIHDLKCKRPIPASREGVSKRRRIESSTPMEPSLVLRRTNWLSPTSAVQPISISLAEYYIKAKGGVFDPISKIQKEERVTKFKLHRGTRKIADCILKGGDVLQGRYQIRGRIGRGTFGLVFQALDTELHKEVAIKVIMDETSSTQQIHPEVGILSFLNRQDPHNQRPIVRLLAHFPYRNHKCLVFEKLSLNLYELLESTNFTGLPLARIATLAKQMLLGLNFLAQPEIDVIHGDLKPENIGMSDPDDGDSLKLIDFGCSSKSNMPTRTYIQSRFYRAPEVLLGIQYGCEVDMWSLGCILLELHTGEPLFQGSDQFEQMRKIVQILGVPPSHMLEASTVCNRRQILRDQDTLCGEPVSREPFGPSSMAKIALAQVVMGNKPSLPEEDQFLDLVSRMLALDPKERINPTRALKHEFFQTDL